MARWPGRNTGGGGGGYGEGGFSDARRRFLRSDNPLDLSFPLFRFLRITVRIHIFFVLFLIVQLALAGASIQHRAISLGMLFFIVVLHEYGHCLACRWVGGEADEVILWPLGGLAMCRPPHNWKAHFVTTAGGPLVNVLLVPVSAALVWWSVGRLEWDLFIFNPFDATWPVATLGSWWSVFAWYFYMMNLVLLGFNVLLIMFPMDGGRLFQELLWARLGYRRSMQIAVNVGLVLAVLLALFGMSTQQGVLTTIAVFCGITCWMERARLRFEAAAGLEEDPYGLFGARARQEEEADGDRAAKRREREQQERAASQAELDRILAKIAGSGMGSLNAKERRFLQADTQRRRGS